MARQKNLVANAILLEVSVTMMLVKISTGVYETLHPTTCRSTYASCLEVGLSNVKKFLEGNFNAYIIAKLFYTQK